MHICFISNEYPTPGQNNGGVGTMIKFIGEYLASQGVRVSVIGEYHTTGKTIENGVNLYRYPISRRPFVPIKRFFRLNQWIRSLHLLHKIDFIETLTNNILFPNEQEITLEDKGRGVDFIKVEKL